MSKTVSPVSPLDGEAAEFEKEIESWSDAAVGEALKLPWALPEMYWRRILLNAEASKRGLSAKKGGVR
jgi:hypothetical protein